MTLEFKLTGIEELAGKLESVKQDVRYRGGRAALRKAAQVVRDAARANASRADDPATPESIEKNIVERWNGKVFKSTGDLAFRVGVLGGARQYANTRENVRKRRVGDTYAMAGDKTNPGGDTWYWRHLEFGTSHAPAHPFMRPAIQTSIAAAINAFMSEYDSALDRAIRRSAKKAI
jgi:HK97 gp10 family phage protein